MDKELTEVPIKVDDRPLKVDPERVRMYEGADPTGIYVRALLGEKWGSHDIAMLDGPSLKRWLRSRGGANEWAEGCVFQLLAHPVDWEKEAQHD